MQSLHQSEVKMIHIQTTQNAKAAFGNAEYGLVSVEFLHLRALCGAKPRFSGPFPGATYLNVGPLPVAILLKGPPFQYRSSKRGVTFRATR